MAKRVLSCGLDPSLSMIGGKWKFLILWHLAHSPSRFGALRRLIADISEKMLVQELKEMIMTAIEALSPFTLAPETPAHRSCRRDKSDHVHLVPKRLSVRA